MTSVSMFRKTVLTTAVVGAGLVSTAGAAFAGDDPGAHDGSSHSHGHHSSSETVNHCTTNYGGSVHNGGALGLGGINGSQGALQGNILCDVLKNNGNGNLSGNHLTVNLLPSTPEVPVDETTEGASTPTAQPVQQAAPAQTTAAPAQSVEPIRA